MVILNAQAKNYSDFISLKTPDTSFRPVGIAFNTIEDALYIASIGKVEVRSTLPNNSSDTLARTCPLVLSKHWSNMEDDKDTQMNEIKDSHNPPRFILTSTLTR